MGWLDSQLQQKHYTTISTPINRINIHPSLSVPLLPLFPSLSAQQTLLTVERAHSELLSQPRGPDPELTEKLQISELKLQAVMETMDTNTKNAQREISELKVQLFEYEMGDAGSLGDELSSVLGGMSRNTSLGSLPSLAAR